MPDRPSRAGQAPPPAPSQEGPEAGFRVLSHPADIGLEFWAPTREAALQQAALGLAHLLGGAGDSKPAPPVGFTVSGQDDLERLFDFLAQLVYFIDAEHVRLTGFTFRPLPDGALAVEAEGERFDPASLEGRYDVKAVTYHQMAFAEEGGKWHGRVYFDI